MVQSRKATPLSDGIIMYTWTATDEAPEQAKQGEFLVVVTNWVGAQATPPRQVHKKLSHSLPNGKYLGNECSIRDLAFGTNAVLQQHLTPAQRIIHNRLVKRRGQVILHAFSNGGAQMATLLAVGLKNEPEPSSVHKLILDCAPERNDPERTSRAITITVPRQYGLRSVATAIFHMMLILYFSTLWFLRVEDAISYARSRLNDVQLFASVPRLYMYSKADQIVDSEDVRQHFGQAREKGMNDVREVVFENSAHCMLLTEDTAKYWGAVEDMLRRDFVDSDQARSKLWPQISCSVSSISSLQLFNCLNSAWRLASRSLSLAASKNFHSIYIAFVLDNDIIRDIISRFAQVIERVTRTQTNV